MKTRHPGQQSGAAAPAEPGPSAEPKLASRADLIEAMRADMPQGDRKDIVTFRVEDPHRQVGLNAALTAETAHARAAALSAAAPGDFKVQRRTVVMFLLTEDVAVYRDGEAVEA